MAAFVRAAMDARLRGWARGGRYIRLRASFTVHVVEEKSLLEGAALQLCASSLQASEAVPRGLMLAYVVN